MASVWDNTLWSTGSVFSRHVCVCGARNGSRLRQMLWVYEHYWGINTALVSLLATLV